MAQLRFADYIEMLNDFLAKYDLQPVTDERIAEIGDLRLEIPADDPVEMIDELADSARINGNNHLAACLEKLSVDLELRIEDESEDDEGAE